MTHRLAYIWLDFSDETSGEYYANSHVYPRTSELAILGFESWRVQKLRIFSSRNRDDAGSELLLCDANIVEARTTSHLIDQIFYTAHDVPVV